VGDAGSEKEREQIMAVSVTIDFGELSKEALAKVLKASGLPTFEEYFESKKTGQGTLGIDENFDAEEFATDQVIIIPHPELTGSGTCANCLEYAYTVWDTDDSEKPELPFHCNCTCSEEIYLPPSHPLKGPGAPVKTFEIGGYIEQNLARFTEKTKRNIIGKRAAKLLKAKIITPGDVIGPEGFVRSSAEILSEFEIFPAEVDTLSISDLQRLYEDRIRGWA
jgi:hypothetical protein